MIAGRFPWRPAMNLQTRPLHKTLACEVEGPRLWEPLDDGTAAELRQLWSEWGVLVFRRQALGEAELAAFNALFGPLERTVRSDWASPAVPEIGIISNLKDGLGRPIGASLYALELPPPEQGGQTFWVDLRAAHVGLPRSLRNRVTGRRGVFDY